jgi:hypothetical protein
LCITDIYESDDALQAAASMAEHSNSTVLHNDKIDDDDDLDDDLNDDQGRQRGEGTLIDNDRGSLGFHITDEASLDMPTQNQIMLEILLKYRAQWKGEHTVEWDKMAAE